MKNVVILCVIAGLLGGSIGYIVPVVIPIEYNKLFSVAILAGIESVCSAIKLIIRDKFKGNIFIITFFAVQDKQICGERGRESNFSKKVLETGRQCEYTFAIMSRVERNGMQKREKGGTGR